MSNDTINKIDEAIKKIKNSEFDNVKDESLKCVKEETDTKIFNGDDLGDTMEFTGITEEIKNIDDILINSNVSSKKKSNIKFYLGYFVCLFVIILLICFFILFLYK